jgi:hypothetical protein
MEQVLIQFKINRITWLEILNHNKIIGKMVDLLPRGTVVEWYLVRKPQVV